jgi:hypothetical protein
VQPRQQITFSTQGEQKSANNETPTNLVPTYGKDINVIGDLKKSQISDSMFSSAFLKLANR